MPFLEDDTKLKIMIWIIVILAVIAVIGIWETVFRPLFVSIMTNIKISPI